MAIETVHLRLQPYSPEHLLALIEGRDNSRNKSACGPLMASESG